MGDPAVMLPNKYGYRLNLNNAVIRAMYERYKVRENLPPHFPVSDNQRRDFEKHVLGYFAKQYRERYGEQFYYPGHDDARERINALIDETEIEAL